MFLFDQVFGRSNNQQDIYEEVQPIIQSFLDGHDVCIFSYGQTGSGKTYTMGTEASSLASEQTQGIIPRALKQILGQVNLQEQPIHVSFQEIYIDSVKDLLDPSNKMTQANQARNYEPKIVRIYDQKQVFDLLRKSEVNRTVAQTACNERSSRSHSILQIQIPRNEKNAQQTDENTGGQAQTTTLSLVDLAGSERLTFTKVEGERLKETQAINKSLSALADVISAMKEKDHHVPYRNSKLTFLLQPVLSSASAKVLMIVNLNPISLNESLCSLRFASKVNSCSQQS